MINTIDNSEFSISNSFPSNEFEVERISDDLELFLSTPTLRRGLADGSLDLASFSSTIESELYDLEQDCIQKYRKNDYIISSLHREMEICDNILASVQEMLLGFRADLSGLSDDIRSLQDQSRTLSIKMRNRRLAESGLKNFLEQLIISPSLVEIINTSEINSSFLDCVYELERKFWYINIDDEALSYNYKRVDNIVKNNIEDNVCEITEHKNALEVVEIVQKTSCGLPPSSTFTGKEMNGHLSKLRLRAVDRIRTYFIGKVTELRKPKTNVRMIQINALLKYAPLMDFLLNARQQTYAEIWDLYVECMGTTVYSLFRTYISQLALLHDQIANRNDLIVVEDSSLRDSFKNRVNLSKRGDALSLGDRHRVLDDIVIACSPKAPLLADVSISARIATNLVAPAINTTAYASPILVHVALAEKEKYPYEVCLKSILIHFMDAATNEYVFVRSFFKEHGPDAFHDIFHRTIVLILEQLENYLFDCHDCLELLLMIKLVHGCKRVMFTRCIRSLDLFFNRTTGLLWPRLKMVMDRHIRSIQDGTIKNLGIVDIHVHYVSRRYAEFICSIILILNKGRTGNVPSSVGVEERKLASIFVYSGESKKFHHSSSICSSSGEVFLNDIGTLLDEFILLLERLSDAHNTNKKKLVFFINNLDQILSVFREHHITSGKEITRFSKLLASHHELFVEEELLTGFSRMIAFVQQTEEYISRAILSPTLMLEGEEKKSNKSLDTRFDVNVQVVESLVREFSSTWKKNIDKINCNILYYFSNFRNGTEILKRVLTQLLLYYTRFQDIIRKVWKSKPPSFCKDLVSTTVILTEIKKYALSL